MSVSTNFREITSDEAYAQPFSDAWRDPSIPPQQLALVQSEFAQWTGGVLMPLFDTLKECLEVIQPLGQPKPAAPKELLEIGCGVGHNSVVVHNAGKFQYTGIDYSESFISLARQYFTDRIPNTFEVMDATNLLYPPSSFDVVLHSACLLHILDWSLALGQAAVLTRRHLVLHRTPISRSVHRYFIKSAYGVDVFEQWFTEAELFERITALGFELKRVWTTSQDAEHSYRTYLLERRRTVEHHPV